MNVITNGSVESIERALVSAHPDSFVHFRGAIEATVEVHAYGFESRDRDRDCPGEWIFSEASARPRAAHRAAQQLAATVTAVLAQA